MVAIICASTLYVIGLTYGRRKRYPRP